MRRVDLQTVLSWLPCPDYPEGRLAELFAGRELVGIAEAARTGIPADDFLWFALHEPLLSAQDLLGLRDRYLSHLQADPDVPGVPEAIQAAIQAAHGDLEDDRLYGADAQAHRWRRGATEPARRAALTALWVAVARARAAGDDPEARHDAWGAERAWQAVQAIEAGG